MTLTLLGLGPGHPDDLSRRAYAALERAPRIIVRTAHHPCVPSLPNQRAITACDDLYQQHADFADVYAAIVERVIAAARQGDVVYAVPGDPMVAEATVTRLIARASAESIPVQIINGISFIEPTLARVGVDAIAGLQIHDAIAIANAHHPPLNPDYPALLGQVYSRALASDLKLTLMNQYPDDFPVQLIHAAGTPDARVESIPLYQIDQGDSIAHLTALYVPAYPSLRGFEALQETIAHLRAPEGCPWDREQTHLSLRKYLLEEAHEVLDALDQEDMGALREELGDLLLQIVLHAQIALEDGEFSMSDIIAGLNHKLIRRHPHVWGDAAVGSAADVVTNWEALKKQEHAEKGVQRTSILDSVPKSLPALAQAADYTAKAAKVGFEWEKIDDVVAKVREELDELLEATDPDHIREELGDVLLMLANWSRWLNIDPEIALRESNLKFSRRFRFVEAGAAAQGRDLNSMTLSEMDALWDQAKAKGL
jgi:tetrapyrrole methylase family protein/MazG family protein